MVDLPPRAAPAGVSPRISSYVEWAPIIAGAIAAAAISFVLLAFGSAVGLSATSPWPNSGLPGWLVAIIAALWVLFVQVGSYALGGYLAGRLRAPVADAPTEERHFRDGAHGFLVWALGVVITALVMGWTAGAMVKTGVEAASNIASGAAQGVSEAAASGAPDPFGYAVDLLLRPGPSAGAEGPPPASGRAAVPGTVPFDARFIDRNEIRRIIQLSVEQASLTEADRVYLARVVASRTGISQAEAERRVDDAFGAATQAQAEAREAADKARKAGAIAGFLAAASLLVAAAAATGGANLGGQHRDQGSTLRMFGRERLW